MKNIYKIKCSKCGKIFEIECTEKAYENHKYKKFCSLKCANSRIHSKETKDKISNALKGKSHNKKYVMHNNQLVIINKCKICGKEYIANTRSKFCSDTCKHLNNFIPTLVKYFLFDKRCIGTENVFVEIERIRNELYDLYWNQNLNGADIAKIYNYPSCCNITGKIFKYLDIPSRNLSETNILNYLNGKLKPRVSVKYKQGWYKTWNNKEIYLHSSYEFDYANELDEKKINYDVECLRIKYFDTQHNVYRCAIPDFYLIDENMIVEIKSSYTLDIQEMKDKVKAYKDLGYNFKLILNHEEVDLEKI